MNKRQEAQEIIAAFKEVFANEESKKIFEYLGRQVLENDIVGVRTYQEYAYLQGQRDMLNIIRRLASASIDKIEMYLDKLRESQNGNRNFE